MSRFDRRLHLQTSGSPDARQQSHAMQGRPKRTMTAQQALEWAFGKEQGTAGASGAP